METTLIPATCVLLLAAFLAAVAQPIFRAQRAWQRPSRAGRTRLELAERKEQFYASIRELEFDRSLGKIDPADYEAVRQDLEDQALDTLRRLDALAPRPLDDAALTARIEADVQALPAVSAASGSPVISLAVKFCTACGAPRQETHRFCTQCGGPFDAVPAS